MSERYTDVGPRRGVGEDGDRRYFGMGYVHFGRRTRAEMLAAFRQYYESQKSQADLALSLTDDQLIVTTYTGVHVQRNCQEVTE